MQKLLNTKEAGKILGCSDKHVRSLIEADMLKALKIGRNNGWRIRPEVLEEFVKAYEGYDVSNLKACLKAREIVRGKCDE